MKWQTHASHRGAPPHLFRRPFSTFLPSLEALEDRTLLSAFWGTFANNAQHTALAAVATQPLNRILWQTPVDRNPQYTGSGNLLIHYGSPLITQANTVIVPVKTGATNGFEVTARDGAKGALRWTVTSDYLLPPHRWVPSYAPVLTSAGRLYFAGAGGTVFYIDNVDSATPTAPVRLAYYGLASYQANASAYNATVSINTPITADTAGNIFFGVRVTGNNPANLTSGIVRLDANGTSTWIAASAAASDSSIGVVPHNCAPALSSDQATLYVGVASASTNTYGYLVGLDSTTLAPKYKVFLWDPRAVGSRPAGLLDDATSSPMVGPDGDVYYGIFGNPNNGSRGWLAHFDSTLTQTKPHGGFGWDSTPALVPASMVPGYTGTSPYLLFEKYNNYARATEGGDGVNQLALLDPNATMVEPHASSNGLRVMNVVRSLPGPTSDASYTGSGYPNAVREWCVNTALVDPATKSILMPNEDGNVYRWDLTTGTLSQVVTVNPGGIGEAYVPTLAGPDGTVYTIVNARLFALGGLPGGLSVSVTSSANPVASYGQPVTFTARVTSPAGPAPTGTLTFRDESRVLATQPVSSSGNTYTADALTAGRRFISAVYSGDGTYPAGSMLLVQAVLMTTNTTVTSSVNPAVSGQVVAFTATVTPTLAIPNTLSGAVLFKDGDAVLGTGALNSSRQATFTTSVLAVGTHPISASYVGDTNFTSSTSSILTQAVTLGSLPLLSFDFGADTSPVATGYRPITPTTTYSATRGYGWQSGVIESRDYPAIADPLTRDFIVTSNGTLAVDLPNGTYTVTATMGSGSFAKSAMGVFLEGVLIDSVSTTSAGMFAVKSYVLAVNDGQLNLGLRNLGGDDPVLNALTITPGGTAPSVPTKFDFGTATSPVASGCTQVLPATVYSAALGYGWQSGVIDSRDYPTEPDPLKRDFHFTTQGVFAVQVATGTYSVTVTLGSPGFGKDQMGLFLEGTRVDSVTTAAGQVVGKTYTVAVSDGQLTLELRDLGGEDPYVVLNGLELVPAGTGGSPGPARIPEGDELAALVPLLDPASKTLDSTYRASGAGGEGVPMAAPARPLAPPTSADPPVRSRIVLERQPRLIDALFARRGGWQEDSFIPSVPESALSDHELETLPGD